MFNSPFFTVVESLKARDKRIENHRWGIFVKGKLIKRCGSLSAARDWIDDNLEDDTDVKIKNCVRYGWDC